MNKALIAIAIVGTAIISPIVGMGITQTREAILGLAPEEAILKLADKIDQTDARFDEASSLVEALQAKIIEQDGHIAEYQVKLAEQEIKLAAQATEQTRVSTTIATQSRCSQLSAEQPICRQDSRYQTKAAFDKMLDELEISSKEKGKRTDIFNKCKEVLAACN